MDLKEKYPHKKFPLPLFKEEEKWAYKVKWGNKEVGRACWMVEKLMVWWTGY